MTTPIPPDATSIFLYSPRHQRMRDEGRMARLSYVAADGTKTAYTREIILAQPDAEAQIAGYEKQFPDAAITGYGTGNTQKFTAPIPALASVGPR